MFREHYEAVCNFAYSFLKDSNHSEDLVQDVFVKLWENRNQIEIEISIKAYLYKTVKNSCLNAIKHEKVKRKHQEFEIANQIVELESQTELEADELKDKINEKILSLPEKRREVFLYSREDGLKYAEIADKLNISIKTVENHMGLALKYLREELKYWLTIIIILSSLK